MKRSVKSSSKAASKSTPTKVTPAQPRPTWLKRIGSLIDNEGRLFGKYDIFLPLFIVIAITLAFFIGRVLLQKDSYLTVELFASGGEWWWNNPEPPYWLTDPVQEGAIEYDPQGGKLVEILDTRKFEVGDRKMLWIKAKVKVTPAPRAKQFRFRREPLNIGSLIYIMPNNVKIFANVMYIEGIGEPKQEGERTITLKEYDLFPWVTAAVNVGDQMRDDDGQILAEVIEKKTEPAETVTGDYLGNLHMTTNPAREDMTLKIRVKTIVSKGRDYFSYFQPLKVGFYVWIPFEKSNISGNIIAVE